MENGARSLEPAPKATTGFSKAQLPTDRLPCLHVTYFPQPLDVLEQGLHVQSPHQTEASLVNFCLLWIHHNKDLVP